MKVKVRLPVFSLVVQHNLKVHEVRHHQKDPIVVVLLPLFILIDRRVLLILNIQIDHIVLETVNILTGHKARQLQSILTDLRVLQTLCIQVAQKV